MKEIISENCRIIISFISGGDFHNLVYVSSIFVIFFIMIFILKSYSIFRKSRLFATSASSSLKHPEKVKYILKRLNIENNTIIFRSDRIMAFCYGIKTPKIYISSSAVSLNNTREIEAIIRHEQYHLLHRDTVVMYFAHLLNSLIGYLPGINRIVQNIIIQREINADLFTVKSLKGKGPLLSVIRRILEQPRVNLAFIPGISNSETLESRIYALTKSEYIYKKPNIFHLLFSFLIIVLISISILLPVYAHEIYDKPTGKQLVCPSSEKQKASYPYTPAID